MKAFDELMRADLRRLRAHALTAHILHIVEKYLSDEDRRNKALRELSRELDEELWRAGVEIVTDQIRTQCGLPPRGLDGWTVDELIILERKRIEAMLSPMPPLVVKGSEI